METYESLELTIVVFETGDVITVSGEVDLPDAT